MNRDALIVFGKNPLPGLVKTRIGRRVGLETAADLYRAFLVDFLERCQGLEADIRLYLAPCSEPIHPEVVPFDRWHLRQSGLGLGLRMSAAFDATFEAGYERVVIIGSDHPTLPLSVVEFAFRCLDEPGRMVIGPSTDGGYYLMGLTEPRPILFEGMVYSHSNVLAATMERAVIAALDVEELPEWNDIDTLEDLEQLYDDLRDGFVQGPRTSALLERLALTENTR